MSRLKWCVGALLALVLAVPAVAAAQAPATPRFTVEKMLDLGRVSDPQLSPDGRLVAYVVMTVSLDKNTRVNHIWLAPAAGGAAMPLIRPDGSDTSPRWSPDGKRLAFISTRGGASEIWVADIDASGAAGDPKKVTSITTEVSSFAWSPDGKSFVFSSDVFPPCTTVACDEKALRDYEARPSKAHVFDHLLFRHWTTWKDGRYSHLLVVPVDGSAEPRDLTPGTADVPPFSLGGPDGYAISPDSKELAFVEKTDPVEAISTNSDIFLVDLTNPSAAPRKITSNPAADEGPTYSPDGRYIAYRSQQRPGFEADRWQLTLYDRQTGTSRSITPSWDRSADGYVWAPDSKTIYLTAENDGRVDIFRLPLAGGNPQAILAAGANGDLHVSPDGKKLVFSEASLAAPAEILAGTLDGGQALKNVTRLTNTNPGLASFKLRPAESVTYDGAAGAKIQMWIVKPPDFVEGRKYPLLYLVHGGPQNSWEDAWTFRWNAQVFASAGYVVAMPNPHGSTGFGQAFTDEISGDWGGEVYEDLMKGADFAEALPYVEKGRTGAAGGSFGGYMMDWFLGHTTRFKAIVTHSGVYNLTSMWGATEELWFPEWDLKGTPWTNREMYAKFSPHMYAQNFKTPTLVMHGELDFRVPIGEGLQLFTTLQRQGVPSKMVVFPDEGHWINKPANSALWYHEFIGWMDRWVREAK
jgi:dipeptidyl aminopeptidase/acylaminoacyl peptidase